MSDQPPKTVNVHSAVQGHGVATVKLTVNRIVDDSDAIGICALICALGFNAASDLGETVPTTVINLSWLVAGIMLATTLIKISRRTVRSDHFCDSNRGGGTNRGGNPLELLGGCDPNGAQGRN